MTENSMITYLFGTQSKVRITVMIITLAASPTLFAQNTFVSKRGYKFDYPKCWKVIIDSPDVDQKIEESNNIATIEEERCKTPRRSLSVPNAISFASGRLLSNTENEILKIENWLKKYHENYGYRQLSIENAKAIFYIEKIDPNEFRWQINIYCPNNLLIEVRGPSMDPKHKDYERTLARIKAGNLDYPMPEKAIIDSIRCVDGKEDKGPK